MSVLLVKTSAELTALEETATAGDTYFNSDTKNIRVWDGSAWRGYDNDGAAFNIGSTCADFDGVDDYISVADADNLSFGDGSSDSPFSLALWLNADTSGSLKMVVKGQGVPQEYAFSSGSAGTPNLTLYDGDVNKRIQITSQTAITQGAWQHWAVTYDGSGSHANSKIYLNGNAVATTASSSGAYVAMDNTSTPVNIGYHNITVSGTSYPTFTDGKMDDVAIFSKALTASEVSAICNSNIYPEDYLVSFWRFEGNANDSKGSNDGTNNGVTNLNAAARS